MYTYNITRPYYYDVIALNNGDIYKYIYIYIGYCECMYCID